MPTATLVLFWSAMPETWRPQQAPDRGDRTRTNGLAEAAQ